MARLDLDLACRAFAAPFPSPAGGSAAAATAAVAASLVVMVGRGSRGWPGAAAAADAAEALSGRLLELGGRDPEAIAAYLAARKAGEDGDAALAHAAAVPFEIAGCALDVAALAGEAAVHGAGAMRGDAVAARELALAAARVAAAIGTGNLALSAAAALDPLRETARATAARLEAALNA